MKDEAQVEVIDREDTGELNEVQQPKQFWSASTSGFYRTDIHGDAIPADAIEITDERRIELLYGQATGLAIVAGKGGAPVTADRERTVEEVVAAMKAQRDLALASSDWTQLPDALTAGRRKLWAEHRKALRDLPAKIKQAIAEGKQPEEVEFPVAPK